MTVVLGRRPESNTTDPAAERRAAWVERFRTNTRSDRIPGGPPPVPLAEVRLHAPVGLAPRSAPKRDGIVGLYAARVDAQRAQRMRTGRAVASHGGSWPGLVPRKTVAVGRGTPAHYEQLYPARTQVPRRAGGEGRSMGLSLSEMVRGRAEAARSLFSPDAWRQALSGSLRFGRMAAPRRVVMASMAALILLAGAATTSFATQQRYEVQPGDTLESIAAEFGVDPEGIYRSSYMPHGWEVAAGQVVIIPEPGQSPAEAAQMAAEREGTSPWVKGAHWVVYGETLGSIGAEWGVSADVLMSFNGITDPTALVAGQRLLIPWERDDESASTSPAVSSGPIVSVPVANFTQTRNLSCEFAATHAATTAFGAGVPEQTFIDSTPITLNPHYGYRGNIDGTWGNTTDYGVYAEALVPTLNAHGYAGGVMYTMGDVAPLRAELDAGHPVVVWLGFWGDTRDVKHDEDTYSVFAGMHVVTAYGYDNDGVYVMDPARGETRYFDWATFSDMWSVVDGMGLSVYPL